MKVIAIARYPVKSMQGEQLQRTTLGPQGIEGDRRHAVVDASSGKALSAKTEGRLLEGEARIGDSGVEVRIPGSEWMAADSEETDAALSTWLGREVRLEAAEKQHERDYEMPFPGTVDGRIIEVPCPPGTFFDLAPVHVLTTASLRAMKTANPDASWAIPRFRPTLLVDAEGDEFIDDTWVGHHLHVGGAVLGVFMPTVRCAMTTRAQPAHGLERDIEMLKTVNHINSSNLGVYANVDTPGDVAAGDTVEVVTRS